MNENTGLLLAGGLVFLLIAVIILFFAVYALFCNSLYKGLQLVPEDKLEFPSWFAWMLLIPVAGFVFMWLVIFINIPKGFGRVVAGNTEAEASLKSLTLLGQAFVILSTLSIIPVVNYLTSLPMLIVWIIYWVKVVEFRKAHLEKRSPVSM